MNRVMQRFAPFVVLCLATVLSVFARVRAGAGALAFYDDDFFYYLKVAIHLAAGKGSTFDGIHATNGYHPLWLLVLTSLARLLPVAMVLNAVMVIVCLSTILTFLLAERCFRSQTRDRWTASLAAAAIAFNTLFLVRGGMEIVLTIPLCLTLCLFRIRPNFRWAWGDATIYGLLASLLVLSRLDSILFVALLFLFEGILLAITPSQKRAPLALTTGILLLAIATYIAINLHIFHTAFPISSQAKQLRLHHTLNAVPVTTLLFRFPIFARLLIVFPGLILIPFALRRVWQRHCPASWTPILSALLLFPLVHLLALSILSDWPLWQWYLYSLLLAEFGAGLALMGAEPFTSKSLHRNLQWAAAASLLLVMAVYAGGRIRSARHPETDVYSMYNAASRIDDFSQSHPGIYAMGDRAGTPGFLVKEPLIQVEGLVMDAPYLDKVKQNENLNQLLAEYHVSYFIATNPTRQADCYLVREPYQAGPDSHSMHGTFCQTPLQQFSYNGWNTSIFDIRKPH